MKRRTSRHAAALGACLLAAACGSAEDATKASSEAPILEVRQPRAQLMPQVGAAYLEIVNQGGADRLLRVESPQASEVQLHESTDDDGIVRMREATDGFAIPASGKLELAPGGKHLMLFGVAPEEGRTELPLTLHFERHEPIEVRAAIPQGGSSSD